ncbi:MAG TPA: S1C family serine protease [Allosphingosinicella sp.]|jgi:serine protease Do|nr:S1C family serine protease [Allosphingosinicella sp.]
MRDGNPLLRFGIGGLVGIALVGAGAVIGANLWPRVVQIRERVIPPIQPRPAPAATGLDALPDLVQQVCPAVVAVQGTGVADGTAGFLISRDGYAVTSGASVAKASAIQIVTSDGTAHDATLIGADPLTGIAVLKTDGNGLPALDFADPNFPRIGQWGVALAAPNGSGCIIGAGLVSADFIAEGGGPAAYIRMRPALDGAFMGSPVVGPGGQVIGIALPAPAGASDPLQILPAATAQRVASELMRTGKLAANRFGFAAEDVTPVLAGRLGLQGAQGAVVSAVKPNSPAGRAGLRVGDIVLSVDDTPTSSASELGRALDTDAHQVALEVQRRDRRLTLTMQAPAGG